MVVTRESLDAPEKLFTRGLWDAIYGVPKGDVTIEHVQHSFYMAANYGFQILNGNFAAAIDDYELRQRFMNDLATYRIYVSWLWSLVRHQAPITKGGFLQRQALTEDGVVLAPSPEKVTAGTRFTREMFQKVWDYHFEWTNAFFAEQDRRGEPARFDRSKAAGHHGPAEAAAPLAALRPAQRPRPVRRGAGERGGPRADPGGLLRPPPRGGREAGPGRPMKAGGARGARLRAWTCRRPERPIVIRGRRGEAAPAGRCARLSRGAPGTRAAGVGPRRALPGGAGAQPPFQHA